VQGLFKVDETESDRGV